MRTQFESGAMLPRLPTPPTTLRAKTPVQKPSAGGKPLLPCACAAPATRGEDGGTKQTPVVTTTPSNFPWTRPTTHLGGAWVQLCYMYCRKMTNANHPSAASPVGAGRSRAAPGRGDS